MALVRLLSIVTLLGKQVEAGLILNARRILLYLDACYLTLLLASVLV